MWKIIYNMCKKCKKFLDEHTSQSWRNKLLVIIVKYRICLFPTPFPACSSIDNHWPVFCNKAPLVFLYGFYHIISNFTHVRTLLRRITVYKDYSNLFISHFKSGWIQPGWCTDWDYFIFSRVEYSSEQIIHNCLSQPLSIFTGLSTRIPSFLTRWIPLSFTFPHSLVQMCKSFMRPYVQEGSSCRLESTCCFSKWCITHRCGLPTTLPLFHVAGCSNIPQTIEFKIPFFVSKMPEFHRLVNCALVRCDGLHQAKFPVMPPVYLWEINHCNFIALWTTSNTRSDVQKRENVCSVLPCPGSTVHHALTRILSHCVCVRVCVCLWI